MILRVIPDGLWELPENVTEYRLDFIQGKKQIINRFRLNRIPNEYIGTSDPIEFQHDYYPSLAVESRLQLRVRYSCTPKRSQSSAFKACGNVDLIVPALKLEVINYKTQQVLSKEQQKDLPWGTKIVFKVTPFSEWKLKEDTTDYRVHIYVQDAIFKKKQLLNLKEEYEGTKKAVYVYAKHRAIGSPNYEAGAHMECGPNYRTFVYENDGCSSFRIKASYEIIDKYQSWRLFSRDRFSGVGKCSQRS